LGRSEQPEFREGAFPDLLWGSPATVSDGEESLWWTLSLFSPAAGDNIDWRRGHYSLLARQGRVGSAAAAGQTKKTVNLVCEGSLIAAAQAPVGTVRDVAPDGSPHPVFCSGFAVSLPLTGRGGAA
jgi:CRISPR/Cas system CSM-associated protein Csm4 (group 5 of RAMP superfamily)